MLNALTERNVAHTWANYKGRERNDLRQSVETLDRTNGAILLWGLMDRRQHERYDLEAPLSFSWRGSGGVRHRDQGLLQNMSGGGVFVLTGDSPPEGVRIQFNMSFDSFFAGSRLVIRARAQVVRVEVAAPCRAGFAAAIKTFTLHNDEKKLIERGTVGEGPKNRKSVKKKTLIKSRPSNLLWG